MRPLRRPDPVGRLHPLDLVDRQRQPDQLMKLLLAMYHLL